MNEWPTWVLEFFIPALFTLFSLVVLLVIQWKLERDVNDRKTFFFFHVANLLFLLMVFGGASLSFGSVMDGVGYAHGWNEAFIRVTLIPLPVVMIVYVISTVIFRRRMRPYIVEKDSNVIYLRYAWKKRG
ncbi:hypothetical protein [Desertibacillus haloalkaliphilus]|uniref:hypothetical protein n=1 Tax=Desertibacillus haloalkaliphilus TaxID=1328930 RepID=UPI001C27E839|nr:hypothetical protein [Desertibacillus haloalkaliphilus]MBU8906483.1 hypothetical protein [Desertibacillus haloalkaliphilus]